MINRNTLESFVKKIASLFQNSVGIYFDNSTVSVVEIKKYFTRYKIIKKQLYQVSDKIFDAIKTDFDLKDKPIAISLAKSAANFRLVKLPKISESEIDNWLQENCKEIVPASIPVHQVLITYQIIKANEELLLLVGTMNRQESSEIVDWIKKEALILTKFSNGLIDVVAHCLSKNTTNLVYYILNESYDEVIIIKNRKLHYYNQIPLSFRNQDNGKLSQSVQLLLAEDFDTLNFNPDTEHFNVLNKDELLDQLQLECGVETEFVPAFVLAKSVFENSISRLNFISEQQKTKHNLFLYKKYTQKSVLLAGAILFSVYLLAFLSIFIVNHLQNELEKEKERLAPQLSSLSLLTGKMQMVKVDLEEAKRISTYKSSTNLILQALAYHIPPNCWLTEIIYHQGDDEECHTRIKGMSKDRTIINNFLGNLERDNRITKVKIDYVTRLNQDKMKQTWKINSDQFLEFQISLTF